MKFTFDPTINLGHIGSVCICGLLAMGAYYDLKGDVRNNRTIVDERWEQQKLVDTNQDRRLDDLKATVEKSTEDIKQEIRGLRHSQDDNSVSVTVRRPSAP